MFLQLSANVQFKTTDPTLDYGKLTRQLGKVLLLLLLLLLAAAAACCCSPTAAAGGCGHHLPGDEEEGELRH